MSILTWSLWTLAGLISLAYILIVTDDILLQIKIIINITGQGIIFIYVIIPRLLYSKQ